MRLASFALGVRPLGCTETHQMDVASTFGALLSTVPVYQAAIKVGT